MKKTLMIFLSFFLIVSASQAQAYKKLLKNANKALAAYQKDTEGNKGKIDEALSLLDEAMAIDGNAPKLFNLKGDIHNAIADAEIRKSLISPDYVMENPKAALTAFAAYEKALANGGDDKGVKKGAIKGLGEVQRHLDNVAITFYNLKDYKNSFSNFSTVLKAHDLLKANSGDSFLADEAAIQDKLFSTAVTGYYGEQLKESTPYFEKLYEAKSEEPLVYEALFKIKSDAKYLEEGRTKFPADKGLMFALINEKIQKNDMAGAKNELEAAIKADPENVSIYVTTGSVYERLGDMDAAKGYYEQAIAKDATNFDATYSLGAMYYNQAAGMTEKINEFANDFSKEGMKKYDAAKKDMDSLFEVALPYFIKAEGINGKDFNTLTALKEIYARKNDLAKAEAYKAKIKGL